MPRAEQAGRHFPFKNAIPPDRTTANGFVAHPFPYWRFTGRSLIPILDFAMGLLEVSAADGQSIHEVLGDDIQGFCTALAGARLIFNLRRRMVRRN
ncbi:DUF1048 domain-containing protein [Streptomyces canus]|uniref:Uncharacterized protein n=1 Tax=Streptomyces canus TaxID=58343 RepID=A0AAW8F3R4_9ACTN|nr:DUF1048 domain-containing protein [Streptomyces canus]MDQ0767163.1 hypothetical protein [Streptomyces canus]MDQ0904802.1 hypothetical protein [Streptomyces canus]MDQ1065204.1 hypothetical protein [Streptomyces canus]